MRVSSDQTANILAALWNAQDRQQTALQQLATGKRVHVPSDDPAAAAALVQNHSRAEQTDQFLGNVDSIRAELQTVDAALSSVTTSLTRAVTLGVQGANGTLSDAQRKAIAADVKGVADSVLQLANLSFGGRFVFAGTANSKPPFQQDPSSPSGISYGGNDGINKVLIAEGRSLATNMPGSQIFSPSGADVFAALHELREALSSGDSGDVADATGQVRNALDHFSEQRVFYSNALKVLDSGEAFLNQEKVTIAGQENALAGIDIAEVISNFSQAQTAHNAALSAAAKILPVSLLDYLR